MVDPRFERPGGGGGDSGDQEVDIGGGLSNLQIFGIVAGGILFLAVLATLISLA